MQRWQLFGSGARPTQRQQQPPWRGMQHLSRADDERHLGGAQGCASITASTVEGATAHGNAGRRCGSWHCAGEVSRGGRRRLAMVDRLGALKLQVKALLGILFQCSQRRHLRVPTSSLEALWNASRPPMEVLWMKIQFRSPDGRWWRSGVVFSLETSSWRLPFRSRWL
jgi:hypothetical protein